MKLEAAAHQLEALGNPTRLRVYRVLVRAGADGLPVGRLQAKIGIAGGALASGAGTVTLRPGKPVTLVNTADGTRYELKLVSTG